MRISAPMKPDVPVSMYFMVDNYLKYLASVKSGEICCGVSET